MEMISRLDLKHNKLLYPFQRFLIFFIHLFIVLVAAIVPQKYKTRIKHIESNSVLINVIGLTLFSALGGLLLMLTNIKLANVLGAAVYGLFSYYTAIGEVGINFVRYGRDKSMTRDLIQQPHKFNGLVSNTFVLSVINLICFMLGIAVFSSQLDVPFEFSSFLIIFATCLVSLDLQPVYESLKLMSWHSLYTILQRLIFLMLIWTPIAFACRVSLDYLSITLFLSWGVVLFIQYKEVITQLKIDMHRDVTRASIISLYKDNFLIAASSMLGVAFGPFIRLILKNNVDAAAVGLYSACFQLFLISKFVITQIARVGNPMMAETGKTECPKSQRILFVKKYLAIMIAGSLPFALPLIFCSGLITDTCFISEYYDIRYYIPMFGVYTIIMSIGLVFEQFLISMRKDRVYFSIYAGCSILTILLSIVLIPKFKLLGGIIAFILPNIIARVLYALSGYIILFKS